MEKGWINVKDKLPITVEEEYGTGQRYFSKDVLVKRGSRSWVANYKPSTGEWYTRNGRVITEFVHFWKEKEKSNNYYKKRKR